MKRRACCLLAAILAVGAIAKAVEPAAPVVAPETVMAELEKPVADIKTQVAGMNQSQVVAHADAYKKVLVEKKEQLAGLTSKLKGLSPMELFGEKGKALKAEVSKYTSQIGALKERYGVYLDALKGFGVDLGPYGIQ